MPATVGAAYSGPTLEGSADLALAISTSGLNRFGGQLRLSDGRLRKFQRSFEIVAMCIQLRTLRIQDLCKWWSCATCDQIAKTPALAGVIAVCSRRVQAFGRLPWFAPFFLRARRLRPVLPIF